MMQRYQYLAAILALMVGVSVISRPVSAQESDVDRIVNQAESDAANRRYLEAVQGYLRAYKLSGSPTHLYNVSVLYLARLDDPLKAWEWAMQFKDQGRNEADARDADKLLGLVDEALKKRFSRVVIQVVPANAGLWLDRREPDAVIARKIAWMPPGPHVIIADSDGYDPAETRFNASLGSESKVRVVLKSQDATLKVSSNVPGTWLWVGTEKVGMTPVTKKLRPGLHHIKAEAEGFYPLEQELVLGVRENRSIKARLNPVPEEHSVPMGSPTVMEKPPAPEPDRTWAWVSFGGSGAALIAGTVLYFVGRKDVLSAGDLGVSDFPEGPDAYNNAFDSRVHKGKSELYAGYTCWGLSGAALVAGIALYFTADDIADKAAIAPMGPGGPGMTALVRW